MDGDKGSARPPEWYSHFALAEKLHIHVWELEFIPMYWLSRALEAMNAEAFAQNELARRRERKAKHK